MINKKKICLILLVMALGACNIVSAEEQQSEALQVSEQQENIKANKETLENAQEAMNSKDYQSAIVLLTAYITSKPKKYEAYKLRGECFYALRQYKLAQRDFQTAIDLKAADDKFVTGTKYISAMVLGADKQEQLQNPELGNLYGELMYAQKALNNPAYEASYDEAVRINTHIYLPKPKKDDITRINCPQKYGKQLNPQGVDAEIMSVIDDIEAGKFHEAMYKVPSITSNYPKYYLGYYLSGVVLAGMEQTDDAIKAFETALKYNPYDFESFASLGEVYYSRAEKTFSSDDAAKSTEYFKKALKYNPHCNTYYLYIGLNELLMKNYQAAISNFNSAIKEKANDYNSMYYKTIAQYMNGDYKLAEEEATKLLYKHVSNYNSVLYLRALAKYKQGFGEDALMDIEKVHNNMNDIYNADIKPLSDREKTLVSYLYYLKSEILKSKGLGTKADLQKAMANPVIANFVSAKREMVLTPVQIDNQFDYIRTTFSDYDLKYDYLNPDYKLTAAKKSVQNLENIASSEAETAEQPEELKPSIAQILASQSLLAAQNKQPETVDIADIVKPVEEEVKPELRPDVNISESEPVSETSEQIAEKTDTVAETEVLTPEVTPAKPIVSEPETEPVEQIAENSPQPIVIEAREKKESQDFQIIKDNAPSKQIISESEAVETVTDVAPSTPVIPEVEQIEQLAENSPQPVIIEAREKKDSQDFQIRYETPEPEIQANSQPEIAQLLPEVKPETVVSEKKSVEDVLALRPAAETTEVIEQIKDEGHKVVEEIQPQKPVSNIVEKHANVNLNEFEIPKPKALPEINDSDEVIVLEPEPTIFNRVEQQVAEPQHNELANRLTQIQPETQVQEVQSEPQVQEIQSEPEIIKPEAVQIPEKVEVIAQENVEKVEKRIQEPTLIIPDVSSAIQKQVEEVETVVADKIDNSALDELAQMLSEVAELEKQEQKEIAQNAQAEEKPVKQKRRWFRKRVKQQETAQVETPAEENIAVEEVHNEPTVEEVQKEPVVEDEENAAISSILQSVFNGNDEKPTADTAVNTEDENLDKLEEVKPLEENVIEEEKPVKEKRRWFRKRAKQETNVQKEVPTEEPLQEEVKSEKPVEDETIKNKDMETSDVSVENAPSDIETETEAPVSEIKAENKPERFGWFKRLFRKKPKATVIDDEQPVSEQKIEETKTEAEPEIIPEIRTEKAEIEQPEEVPVNDIQPEQKRKRFNLFRKKQNTAPAEVEIQPEIVPETEPVKPVKKVIKQMEK